MTEQFPEMLSALQLAALYCSRKQNWDAFEEWVTRLGGLEPEEHLSREFMAASAKSMDLMIRQVEIELLAARLNQELGSGELSLIYVAGTRGMRGNGHRDILPPGTGGEKARGCPRGKRPGGAGEEDLRRMRGQDRVPGIRAGIRRVSRDLGRADSQGASGTAMGLTCFSCGLPMRMLDILTGWCDKCQVMERHETEPYLCRVRHVTYQMFWGEKISYLDHGEGHYPSPA